MLGRTAAAALLLALAASPAASQAPFYQGKQIKVLVGFPPGGGADIAVVRGEMTRRFE